MPKITELASEHGINSKNPFVVTVIRLLKSRDHNVRLLNLELDRLSGELQFWRGYAKQLEGFQGREGDGEKALSSDSCS